EACQQLAAVRPADAFRQLQHANSADCSHCGSSTLAGRLRILAASQGSGGFPPAHAGLWPTRHTHVVNEALLDLINGDIAGRWDVLDDQVAWWAANGLFVLAAIAAAFGLWQLRRQPRAGLTVAMAVCLGA